MKVAMIGLGRMGMNMARRLLDSGHEVVAYNRTARKTEEIAREGATAAYVLTEVAEKLTAPRLIWIMLPAGPAVDEHIVQLKEILSPGDIVIDGGNSHFKDDLRRSESLAPQEGYLYCGPTGAGHFVKMVHNGIEYGMMQAYGEGFQILEASPYAESLNYRDVAHLWNQGSVVRSWMLELAEAAFSKDGKLTGIQGVVEDSGEGRWTVNQAVETGVSAPVITLSLMNRFRSRDDDSFSDRLVAVLRREFGGHPVAASQNK